MQMIQSSHYCAKNAVFYERVAAYYDLLPGMSARAAEARAKAKAWRQNEESAARLGK